MAKLLEVIDGPEGKFEVFDGNLGDPIAHDPAWVRAYTDVKNDRFRDIGVLRGPDGHIEDRVTVRVAMERDTRDRLAQAADLRGTSTAEIIRVLITDWLDEVKA